MAKTSYGEILFVERIQWLLYCIVSIHLYSASCSAHQSEALPVQKTQREELKLEVVIDNFIVNYWIQKLINSVSPELSIIKTFLFAAGPSDAI